MKYEKSFKQHCVNLVVQEGHTKTNVIKEFQLSQGITKKWIWACEPKRTDKQADLEHRQRNLEKEKKLLKKGNDFLKKKTPSLLRTKMDVG